MRHLRSIWRVVIVAFYLGVFAELARLAALGMYHSRLAIYPRQEVLYPSAGGDHWVQALMCASALLHVALGYDKVRRIIMRRPSAEQETR